MIGEANQTDCLYEIGDAEFDALRELMYRETGVSLSETKRALMCSRLARRLRGLDIHSYDDYIRFLSEADPDGEELQKLVNSLTTNKTDFMRESHHFDFLRDVIIPEAQQRAAAGGPRRLRIWSAACSQGDEPYSIAMTVLASLPNVNSWDVKILASDINTEVLATAEAGKYPLEKLDPLPEDWKRRYLLRGSGGDPGTCQIHPEVKRLITFRQINLTGPWPYRTKFDVIFCRNVIIYFDQETRERLLKRLGSQLNDSGYMMLGHSENSPWLAQTFESLGQTIFRRRKGTAGIVRQATQPPIAQKPAPVAPTPRSPVKRPPIITARAVGKPCSGPAADLQRKNILAGQTWVLSEPGEITTVLGSCVAVCLYDPQSGVGGMNHFMLPVQAVDSGTSARYGVHAMELLITGIMKKGGDRGRLQAKAFGGANLLQLQLHNEGSQIGRRNVEFLRDFLSLEEIPLVSEKLGGEQPMRIYFQPHTGRVVVKTMSQIKQIMQRERKFTEVTTECAQETADVTLF